MYVPIGRHKQTIQINTIYYVMLWYDSNNLKLNK